MNIPKPPEGSRIEMEESGSQLRLSWDRPSGGWIRYGVGAFLIFWLCGWAAGLFTVLGSVLRGEVSPFTIIWLCGWAIAGVGVMFVAYRILRPPKPEILELAPSTFFHDPGCKSLLANYPWGMMSRTPGGGRRSLGLFKKRRIIESTRDKITNIQLTEPGVAQRLTYDIGADRLEVGSDLREPEREWLAEVLRIWNG